MLDGSAGGQLLTFSSITSRNAARGNSIARAELTLAQAGAARQVSAVGGLDHSQAAT